jgi:hypothetical protein
MSLLAVAYDEARSDNPGRLLAKQTCSVIRDAVEPLAPGMIGRYDDEFEVRAFGDNLTKWGTSVVLIETGPYPGPDPDRALVRINFVALLTALDALASGRAAAADIARYEGLPLNTSNGLFHTIIRNATVASGTGVAPFQADVGISGVRTVRERKGTRQMGWTSRIDDLGDLRVFGALETIDAEGMTAAPMWNPDLAAGQEVSLPEPGEGPTIAPGQPAAIVLLQRATTADRYVIDRIVRVE